MKKTLLFFLLAALTVSLLAACSGGGGPVITAQTGLDGQFVQGITKVTSNAGDGLSGVEVELISRSNGQVAATTVTTADGRFSFRQLPNGSFLLKIRFRSSVDLDGDGLLDEIESYIPVEVLEDVVSLITAALDFSDDDNDSDYDSLKVDIRIKRGENGSEDHSIRIHRHRHGDTKVDDDGDGDFDDSFDDDDNNGLPDGTNGGGNYPQGPKLRGEIEAISDTSITVNGQTFEITDATHFRIRGDRDADASEFEVGDEVQVTSFTDADGAGIALEIKLKNNRGHGGGDDDDTSDDELEIEGDIEALTADSITVNGRTFLITVGTSFFFLDKTEAQFGDFAVGDIVELKARLVNDEWVAVRVR
ncbi:MAG: DUF5666 domain-containing protein, partial [bacterium]|nr:DUF5666 domain-containing protein [bacterium]